MSLLKASAELTFDVELAKRLSRETQFTKQFATNNIRRYDQSFHRLLARCVVVKKKTTSARLGAWRKTYYTVDREAMAVWLKSLEDLGQ